MKWLRVGIVLFSVVGTAVCLVIIWQQQSMIVELQQDIDALRMMEVRRMVMLDSCVQADFDRHAREFFSRGPLVDVGCGLKLLGRGDAVLRVMRPENERRKAGRYIEFGKE